MIRDAVLLHESNGETFGRAKETSDFAETAVSPEPEFRNLIVFCDEIKER